MILQFKLIQPGDKSSKFTFTFLSLSLSTTIELRISSYFSYVSQPKALSNPGVPLISYQKNAQGGMNAIMRADNSATLKAGVNRNSIRIVSTTTFNVGSLIIADMDHVPFGCSLWPAYWLVGPNWPMGGEIDIFEGINNGPYNQATLHTNNGCARDLTGLESGIGGSNTNCSTSGGYGCSVTDHNTQSYGAGTNLFYSRRPFSLFD